MVAVISNHSIYPLFFALIFLIIEAYVFNGKLLPLIIKGWGRKLKALWKRKAVKKTVKGLVKRPADYRKILKQVPYPSGLERTGTDKKEKAIEVASEPTTLVTENETTPQMPAGNDGRIPPEDLDRAFSDYRDTGADSSQQNEDDDWDWQADEDWFDDKLEEEGEPIAEEDYEIISQGVTYDELEQFIGLCGGEGLSPEQRAMANNAAEQLEYAVDWKIISSKFTESTAKMREKIAKTVTGHIVPEDSPDKNDEQNTSFNLEEYS